MKNQQVSGNRNSFLAASASLPRRTEELIFSFLCSDIGCTFRYLKHPYSPAPL